MQNPTNQYFQEEQVELLKIAMEGATSIESGFGIYRTLENFLSGRIEKLKELQKFETDLEEREKIVSEREKSVSRVYGPETPRSKKWNDEHERRIMESFGNMPPERQYPILETIYEYMKIRKVDRYLITEDNEEGGRREREIGTTAVTLGRGILNYMKRKGALRFYTESEFAE